MTPSMSRADFWQNGDIPWLSSKEITGGVLRTSEKTVSALALKETGLRLVPAGSVAIVVRSGILVHTFPVAYVPFDVTVNQDVKIGTPRPGVDGRFLAYLLESMQAEVLARYRKTGTTVQSLNVPALLAHRVWLPPLDVQRRIVDLVGHLDALLMGHDTELTALRDTLNAMLERMRGDMTFETSVALGSLTSPRSGASWSAKDETSEGATDTSPVVKITNTKPDGSMDLRELMHVRGLSKSVSRLDDRSLVLIRTNGNRARIGNVYRPPMRAYGAAVSAFQFSAQFESTRTRDWVYWWLRHPRMQTAMSEAASGSTGLGNLSAGWLKALQIPTPSVETRDEWIELLDSAETALRRSSDSIAALREGRSALLTAVLSGAVGISESYDSLLGAVA